MTPMEEVARYARGWSWQTIIFTLQSRLGGAETAAEEQAHLVRLSDESVEIMNELLQQLAGFVRVRPSGSSGRTGPRRDSSN
jgi:hypothetical protein